MIKVQNQPGHVRLLIDKCHQNAKLKTSFCFGAEEPTFSYWREDFFPMSLFVLFTGLVSMSSLGSAS